MSQTRAENILLKRVLVVFSAFLTWTGILLWILLIIRNSEYLQEGYYFFNGNIFVTYLSLMSIFIVVLVNRLKQYPSSRYAMLVLSALNAIFLFILLQNYLNLWKANPEPYYILLGIFLQKNIVYVGIDMCLAMTMFLLNLQYVLIPYQVIQTEKSLHFTLGVGFTSPTPGKQAIFLGSIIGGGFIGALFGVYLFQYEGLFIWLCIFYGGSIIIGIFSWITSRGIYCPPQEKLTFQNETQNKIQPNGVLVGAILSLIILFYSVITITNQTDTVVLIRILAITFIMLITNVFDQFQYKPTEKSDLSRVSFYNQLTRNSWGFLGYAFYGGILLFAACWLFNINIDRNNEFLAMTKLLFFTGMSLIISLMVIKTVTPKFMQVIAVLCIVSEVFLNLKVADFAMSTPTFWQDRYNVILGFPFHQSFESAFLCGSVIGIVLATYLNKITDQIRKTYTPDANLFMLVPFFLLLWDFGLTIGHDLKFSGLSVAENIATATEVYATLAIIFYVAIGLFVVTLGVALLRAYQELQKKEQSLIQLGGN
jgi:hypothetical protein